GHGLYAGDRGATAVSAKGSPPRPARPARLYRHLEPRSRVRRRETGRKSLPAQTNVGTVESAATTRSVSGIAPSARNFFRGVLLCNSERAAVRREFSGIWPMQ